MRAVCASRRALLPDGLPAIGRLTVGWGCAVAIQVGVGEVVACDDAGQNPQALDALSLLLGCQPSPGLATHAILLSRGVPALPRQCGLWERR